jgi:nucleoside-diphosphate-sugar epimerase
MRNEHDVVIVTGSSGFIGAAAVRRLIRGYQVVGFDHAGNAQPPAEAECVCLDVTSDGSVEAGLARVRYAYGDRIASVIHLAAYYDFSGAPSPKYEEITVRGTERLLRGLQAFEVEQFVFSSTMLVERPSRPGGRLTEDSPVDPAWAYPKSKVATEAVIREARGSIPVVLARIAGVYDDEGHSLPLAHQIQRIHERQFEGHVFPGHLSEGRQSFVHLADLIDAFERMIERRRELPEELVVLLGEPDATSYGELQHELGCLIHGEAWKTHEVPEELARAGAWVENALPTGDKPFIKPWMVELADDNYELDVTRARTLLGWEPRHSLRAALPGIVAALKADPARWYRENKLETPPWIGKATPESGLEGSHGH